jgi:predicted DNA-binding transcriptional regulator AlpA
MPDNATYTARHIARLMQISRQTFYNKRPHLERHGFPKRLPNSRIWSAAQVDAWIAGGGDLSKAELIDAAIGRTRTRLEQRYSGRFR